MPRSKSKPQPAKKRSDAERFALYVAAGMDPLRAYRKATSPKTHRSDQDDSARAAQLATKMRKRIESLRLDISGDAPLPGEDEVSVVSMRVKRGANGEEEGWHLPPRLGTGADETLAELALSPALQAGSTICAYGSAGGAPLRAIVNEVQRQGRQVQRGDLSQAEAMLISQAQALDAIFGSLARTSQNDKPLEIAETYLRLALKAQSQCRATLETLANIKNPPLVFAKQANISHGHQQVNNGSGDRKALSRTREIESTPNKLLEVLDGERLDDATKATAGRADQTVAAMGKVNGASHPGRKTARESQRVPGQ
jgi:hypothetical protein